MKIYGARQSQQKGGNHFRVDVVTLAPFPNNFHTRDKYRLETVKQ